MTRTELRDKMLQSGDIHRPDKFNPFWVQAFELYKLETKDYEVSPKCGSCFRKVGEWLRK